jgi:hypothetical protein
LCKRVWRLTFHYFNYLKSKNIQICCFVEPSINDRNLVENVWKRIQVVGSRCFHLTFQRIFSDFPFSRSSHNKTTTFDAYVEKVRKNKNSRRTTSYTKCGAKHDFEKSKTRKQTKKQTLSITLLWELYECVSTSFSRTLLIQRINICVIHYLFSVDFTAVMKKTSVVLKSFGA